MGNEGTNGRGPSAPQGAAASAEGMMKERLRRRLAALGWNGSLEEACVNIAYQYLVGAFDPSVLRPFMNEDGSATKRGCEHEEFDLVWASTSAMLDEAERVGRSDLLAPPAIKTSEQVLDLLNRRFWEG